nr:PREDICTED: afadin isoform X9 [Linepithema humile]
MMDWGIRRSIMFHVRRRPADYMPRKRKKKPAGKWNELDHRYEDERLPFLLELNSDGSDIPNGAGVRHRLQPNVTEVGSERPIGPQAVQAQTLTLPGPTVMPRHCVIAFTENIVTLTPCSRDAHTYVNNQRIHQTTILQNGAIVKFGRMYTFRFIDPAPEERIRQRHDSNKQIDYAYDRRSPDATSQDVSSEKFHPGSATSNGSGGQTPGQTQERAAPSSPSKSAAVAARSPRSPTHPPESTHNYETTFDLDGNVETASLSSSRDGNRLSQYDRQAWGADPILPAVLEFLEETEEAFLHAVITDVEPSAPQFKLAPTYTLYLSARYRASTHYRPELQPTERAHRLTLMLANVATMIQRVIQERYMNASSLAFWLANGSELLHMLKSDRHVGAFSTRAQDILVDAVHTAFGSLVRCVTLELTPAMTQFMADADEPAKEAGVLQIFSNTMTLLRRCRVNAALTIQLFSHLFHAINATAFNTLVSNGNLCVRWFGRRLKARLNALETWAERQGLELASQCHLATIMQATHLLQAPKYNAEELATLSSTCFKLNSLQVRALLQKYQPATDEPRLPAELIENVVRVAESVADTLARADGREIRLEEEPVLGLALLLPEDGYSCEVIRGVPPGLAEFLAPLQRDGLCRMAAQPTSSGYWTIYMIDHHNNMRSPSAMSNRSGGYVGHINQNQAQPEIQVIKLHKSTNGMGLSIVAAKGAGQDRLGIYIKSVVAGGAADADGRLTAGDQLLKVDGQSLVGITQEKAAEYLVRTGPIVTLEVAKQGAIYHGLATLLSQPSPVMTRGPRRMSERDLSSRLGYDATPQQIHSSKSVPALHNMGTEVKQQHEVFNPGYSRASSSNSVTPPVQPPPMATINSATALRSRSSHNLHDPMRAGALPPTGLVSRQQSSPNLNPNVTHANVPLNAQNTEVERFYQNLSIYRNQEAALKQQLSPQQSDDRNLQHNQNQKNTLRGSQNSLNRPSTLEATNYIRDRPTSAYVTQGQQQSYSAVGSQMQQQNVGPSSRSQSTRDIIRQEAKMQEMQEEVRRRELRGGAPMLGQHRPPMYNVGARGVAPATQQAPPNALSVALPKPSLGSTSNLGVASGYAARQNAPGYNYTDIQHVQHNNAQYNQYGQYNQYPNRYPVSGGQYGSMLLKPKNEAVIRGHQSMPHESPLGKDQHNQQEAKASAEQSRHFAGSQNSPHYPNGSLEQRVDQYTNDGMINRAQNGESNPAATSEVPPTRPTLPSEEFNESPPPPPPDTSTHPLYNKQADMRYMASMQDPPRGSYYPAGGISAMQQPRQYQYSATNPWQREEREKEQARRREAARQWRDQQIAELSALTHRTQQQEEQLRALQLERDFQKRAEEAANQDDDEESNDLDNESTQRIQDLFRMAASQERTIQGTQQPPILSRTNVGNQSIRGGLSLQLVGNQPVISGHTHILSGQAATQNVGASGADQEGGDLHVQSSHQQQQQQQQQQRMPANQSEEQMHMPTNYGTPLGSHFSSGQKSYSMGMLHSIEDKELQRKMDETKRKQADLEESQKKQEEHQLHSQQQAYQQSQHARSQQSLHPSMLRLDNLIINGSNVPMPLQHNINDAPPPPERGSSYAVMSQQNALRSNSSIASNLPPASQQPPSLKRVSFHDSNANSEPTLRNVSSATPNPPSFSMNTIREDPNNFINDAENLLASPKTPEGSGTSFSGATPGVIGAQEVYKDPRQKRLAEKQKQQNLQIGAVPEKLSFKEKMKMFAMETGEDGTPRDKVKISRAQREIDNISSPLNSNNNNNNINNISGNNNTNSNRT